MEKRGEEKGREGKDKLKVRSNNLFSMECIGVTLPTLVLTKRFVFDCSPSKSREWIWFEVFNKVNYIPLKIFLNKIPHQVALLELMEPSLDILIIITGRIRAFSRVVWAGNKTWGVVIMFPWNFLTKFPGGMGKVQSQVRGELIQFHKVELTIIVKWPGVWGRKKWAGEGKKERKEKEKKEREKSRANHRKDWWHIIKETNQVSLFLLPTNKRSIHMG